MTTIYLLATDQSLSCTQKPKVASGNVETVMLHIDFSSEWDGYTKTAVFFTEKNKKKVYEKVLALGDCTIPQEVLVNSGDIYIGVRGTGVGTKVSALLKYKIVDGAPSGEEPEEIEPTSSLYEQIVEAFGYLDNAVQEEKEERKADIAMLTNYVTPQMFGAIGDGVADDTKAFQDAINNSDSLFVPSGVYLISGLVISKPIRIYGASKTTAILKYNGTEKTLTLKPNGISSSEDFLQVEVENIGIIADNAETAIYMNETVHSVFRNIHVGGRFEKGFEMDGESNIVSKFNTIYNNHFEEITVENCAHAFDIMGCISDTHFNLITIMHADKGVYIHGDYEQQGTNNVTFTNSTIIWTKEAFEINGCHYRNLHISGCNFELFDNYGVKIDPVSSDAKNISIVNSFFMPSSNASNKTICVRLNKVSSGVINNLIFQNTISGVVGVDTTGSLLMHVDALAANNGSTITHTISNGCYYHKYEYENNLDMQVFNVGVKAPRLTTTGGISFWDGENRRSMNFVNGHLLTTVDDENGYILAYMGTSVIKSLNNVKAGSCIFDGTLGKPVFYSGTKWVDATGEAI